MPAARNIQNLTDEEVEILQRQFRQTENADTRTHCPMILLSNQGHSVAEGARQTFFDEDTVLYWFDGYEAEKLKGLEDRPHRGRLPKSKKRI